MVYNFFNKTSNSIGANIEIKQNEELAEELHKPIIVTFYKRRVHSLFIDNIWVLI